MDWPQIWTKDGQTLFLLKIQLGSFKSIEMARGTAGSVNFDGPSMPSETTPPAPKHPSNWFLCIPHSPIPI
jgi:hypothetical protein